MKTKIKIISFLVGCFVCTNVHRASAQANNWDVPLTEQLIGHNKKNFSDNQQATTKQINLTASATLVKSAKDKCKQVMTEIDKRLNSLYIIVADATLAVRVAASMKDIYDYQNEAVQMAIKYPWLALLYYNNEEKIIQNAQNLYSLIALVVISYGDISKMDVSDRKIVYTQIIAQLQYLASKCSALNSLMTMAAFADTYKNAKGFQFINMDKDKVNSILKNWKGL